MNWLDLAVLGILVLSALFAFARGFVREALSIVAWGGAAYITAIGFNWAYGLIDAKVHNPLLSQVAAVFGLFVVSLIVLTIATGFLARLIRFDALTPIDRTLGFIFGLARGAFLLCLAFLLLDLSVPQANDRPEWIRSARSTPYLHEGADVLKGLLPESLKTKSADAYDRLLGPRKAAAEQAKEAVRAYANPTPETRPAATQAPSYPAADRRTLNRIIGTQQ